MKIDYEKIFSKMAETPYKDDVCFDNVINFHNAANRCLFLDEIQEGVGGAIVAMIQFYNAWDETHNIPVNERKPIKLYINSPGGLLSETFMMVDAIKMSKTPVYGIVAGCAYSGGFFTLLSCHKRIAFEHASFLYHEGSTATEGTAGQFENYAAFYKKQLNKLKDLVLSTTKITEEEYKDIKKDDIWYDTTDALEKGIIDEITKELI